MPILEVIRHLQLLQQQIDTLHGTKITIRRSALGSLNSSDSLVKRLNAMTVTEWKQILERRILVAMKMSAREGKVAKGVIP